ncbi:flavin reductase family protein [Nocardioides nitrophenolicus]|uniref:flavin reductase family protein n=1 Tax=Nocardioides nitrophenolicus TaxID=60489 RepID=UPI000ACC6044|nr:flavin reductase family protein [Nocardioides nitrophenolicus]MBM7518627.1 flavin reductase (DIM6/NTAB) family NADH-FMN oxidoreductase RutF [Nocardioides nitrophenolicus]
MSMFEKAPLRLESSYRDAISHFATGVTVITTTTESGHAGMTASAVTSLSLDPLQLLTCLRTELPTRSAIELSGRFAVNVLGAHAEDLAIKFATPSADKFAGVPLVGGHPVPVLREAIAYFVCDLAAALPGGDHTIMVGNVVDCGHRADSQPLVHFSRQFSEICTPATHERQARQHEMSW